MCLEFYDDSKTNDSWKFLFRRRGERWEFGRMESRDLRGKECQERDITVHEAGNRNRKCKIEVFTTEWHFICIRQDEIAVQCVILWEIIIVEKKTKLIQ